MSQNPGTLDATGDVATESKQDDIIAELQIITENIDTAINVQFDSTDANLQYVGIADPGSLTSAAVWKIFRVDCTTGTIITWADGNDNADNIYDNRESLSYS